MPDRIYNINDLQELRKYLAEMPDIDKTRALLFGEFMRYSRYKNVAEWNKAVRICECLAIVGWGEHEPLEAIKDVYFNGNPNTYFINKDAKPRLFDAVWSKRKEGLAINYRLSSFREIPDAPAVKFTDPGIEIGEIQDLKLNGQRNWIAKNPIYITRGLANCYDNSRAVIESIEKELKPALDIKMRPDLYGHAINHIILNCSFSFYDNYHCKTNYIIADEALKLKQKDLYPTLLGMYSEKEIEDNGYYLRNRFSHGPFRSDTGTTRIIIVFEKEFSELTHHEQKKVLSQYFIQAVQKCADRLSKKIEYNFDLMISDFSAILNEWQEQTPMI